MYVCTNCLLRLCNYKHSIMNIRSVALLWRNSKCNVNPGLSYFEQCSLACACLLSNLRLHFLSSSNTAIFMNSICFPPFSLLKGPNLFGLVDTSISKHRIPKILGHFHCMMWINIKPNKCTFFSYDPSILLSFYIHSVYRH